MTCPTVDIRSKVRRLLRGGFLARDTGPTGNLGPLPLIPLNGLWSAGRQNLDGAEQDQRYVTGGAAAALPEGARLPARAPVPRRKNYAGGPLRYASVQELWAKYRAKAKVTATIHQLRHVHATELVNAGVSLETIRRRLGHANAQTVLRYADQHDTTADAEIRSWRRRKITGRSGG